MLHGALVAAVLSGAAWSAETTEPAESSSKREALERPDQVVFGLVPSIPLFGMGVGLETALAPRVTLKLGAGAAYGYYDFTLVGTAHLRYWLVGQLATPGLGFGFGSQALGLVTPPQQSSLDVEASKTLTVGVYPFLAHGWESGWHVSFGIGPGRTVTDGGSGGVAIEALVGKAF